MHRNQISVSKVTSNSSSSFLLILIRNIKFNKMLKNEIRLITRQNLIPPLAYE